jgi:CBS domain-containing protein
MYVVEIREVMTEWVVTAPPACTAREAAETMRDRDVGCIVFIDPAGAPVGLITDRDLTLGVLADGRGSDDPAIFYASSPVVSAPPELAVDGAIELMTRHQIRRLPVLENDHVIGIVTLTDLLARCAPAEAARVIAAQKARASMPALYFHQD